MFTDRAATEIFRNCFIIVTTSRSCCMWLHEENKPVDLTMHLTATLCHVFQLTFLFLCSVYVQNNWIFCSVLYTELFLSVLHFIFIITQNTSYLFSICNTLTYFVLLQFTKQLLLRSKTPQFWKLKTKFLWHTHGCEKYSVLKLVYTDRTSTLINTLCPKTALGRNGWNWILLEHHFIQIHSACPSALMHINTATGKTQRFNGIAL